MRNLGAISLRIAGRRRLTSRAEVICATGITKNGGSGQTHDFCTNISGKVWQTLSTKKC